MVDYVLNGNTFYLRLLYNALDNYVEFRDLNLTLSQLTDEEKTILNFAYKNTDTKARYLETLSKLLSIRIYHEITQIENSKSEELSKIIDYENAKNIALEFASLNGVEDGEVVWNDTIKEDVYLNIAPKQNGIILYPDLVKVKVNLVSGTVVGYDATSYFTNHVNRTLSKGSLSLEKAKAQVPSKFAIVNARYVLSPLDYNREVVCVEVEATGEGSTYYFYYNVNNGILENVLKVIQTDDGSLLM